MLDEEAHVDGTVERVEKKIQISILAEFAADDSAAQGPVGLAPARPQEAVTKGGNQVFIALAGAENSGNNAALWAAEDLHQLPHLSAHVGVDRTGVGKTKLASGAAGKGVGDQCCLVGPPAVNGGFANRRVVGDVFNRETWEASFLKDFQRAAQDGQACLLAAGTPRRTLATAVRTVGRRRLLAHNATLPYNRPQVFRIRYAEYRI